MVYSDVIPLIFCCRSCRHVEPYCFRSFSLSLLLLAASGTIRAQAQDPFTQNRLPDLGMMPESHEGEKHFAEMAKAFGEASMKNNDLDTGEQARQFAFGQVRDVVSEQVNQQRKLAISTGQRQRGY